MKEWKGNKYSESANCGGTSGLLDIIGKKKKINFEGKKNYLKVILRWLTEMITWRKHSQMWKSMTRYI